MPLRFAITFTAALVAATLVHAHDYKVQDLHIDHPFARATVPHQPSGAAYLSIENKGNTADKLISAETPVAKSVEIHSMSMDGNVMRMREIATVEIGPRQTVALQPGGIHLMLLGLREPLKAGEKFPLTLTFEKTGKTQVMVHIEDRKAPASNPHQHHKH